MSYRSVDIISIFNGSLIDLPSPSSLSYMWNFGSLLGIFLMFQIVSGLFLAIHYSNDVVFAFSSVVHIERDVNWGMLNRVIHSNGASFFFLFLYNHISRGLYFGSYVFSRVWLSGSIIFLMSMMVAFLGYVLPWGQMSFWAATVITNLLSVLPIYGSVLVEWVWGGYAIGNPTLSRFFSFHFLFPFVILLLVVFHLFSLHEEGSGNPMGINSDLDKVSFHWLYVIKDVFGLVIVMMIMMFICLEFPYIFMDVENFSVSDPLVTPIHILPEWYFLYAYAILRSIPNKMGGVVGLVMSVAILLLFPYILVSRLKGVMFYFFSRVLFWMFVVNWLVLMWCGSCVVEQPFIYISQMVSINYFFIIVIMKLLNDFEDKIIWF